MSDLISRQAAIDALDGKFNITGRENAETIRDYINGVNKKLRELPSAERRGRWIWMGDYGDSRFMCSVCKSKEKVPTIMGKPTIWSHCPNCGAKMEAAE